MDIKNKILVVGPMLPQWSDITYIAKLLDFLNTAYSIHYVDPLDFYIDNLSTLKTLINEHEILFGFSFGGVMLQSLLEYEEMEKKKIVLFSTPSFSDESLNNKFNRIKKLISEGLVKKAVDLLNSYASFPHQADHVTKIADETLTGKRLNTGLNVLLNTDNRSLIEKSNIHWLHFIGLQSGLVCEKHVVSSKNSLLIKVPYSGMRVLKDNLSYCKAPIMNYLEGPL